MNKINTTPDESRPVANIAPGIYRIRLPLGDKKNLTVESVNVYLLKGTDGYLLIDTGWYQPAAFETLQNSLRMLNLSFKDIRTIMLTHSHPDHYGAAGKIRQEVTKLEVLCHRWEADLIESRYIKFSEPREDIGFLLEKHGVPEAELEPLGSASMPVLSVVNVTTPDHVLYGGEIIRTGVYDLEVIWTPGHSPGHICFYEPQNKLLFCGDHILPTITPNVGYHVLSGDNPLGNYLNSLNKLVHLEVACVHPGHEYSFQDLKSRIKAITVHHHRRQAEIRRLIARGFTNSYEIALHLTWSLNLPWNRFPPLHKRSAITETIAHLEYMRWEGKIKKIIDNNHVSYTGIDG
jgi:glyoxylase-like metal-dependent hydrolase (beta-lactamase superfamily II)